MSMTNDWPIHLQNVKVPAKPSGLWTLASEFIQGPALVRFSTSPENEWNYASKDAKCSADGALTALISPQACVLPGAPVGALIAKFGGSTAGQSDGKVFLVGSFAIIPIDAAASGPLYLTINDEPSGMTNNTGTLDVSIWVKPQPAGSPLPAQTAQTQTTPTPSGTPTPSNRPPAKMKGAPKP